MEKNELIKQIDGNQVMDSRDVAKMVGKRHRDLMRDIRRYISDLEESAKLRSRDMKHDPKLDSAQFFIESSYEWTQKGKKFIYDLLKEYNVHPVLERMDLLEG